MIDWTKPVETRDGRKVRVLCTDGPGEQPVVGLLDGFPTTWCLDGRFHVGHGRDHGADIVEKYTVWINVYPDSETHSHSTWRSREAADRYAGSSRIKCIPVEYTV